MFELLLPALLGGIGIATLSGPLGAFVVWRRMAYFGDTLAHSALLGVALGLFAQVSISWTIAGVCLVVAILLVALQKQSIVASDTLLGILSHSSLALGLVVVSLMPGVRVDLMAYLFGDLLALNQADLWRIYAVVVAVIGILIWSWKPLLSITIDEALAHVDGIPVQRYRLLLMVMLALVIAFAMKVVGILLVTSLLIIPAAAARRFSQTPEQMALIAAVFGNLAIVGGIGLSAWLDTPVGPSIVLICFTLFLLSYGTQIAANRRQSG